MKALSYTFQGLATTLLVTIGLCFSPIVSAQTTANADTAVSGYHNAFFYVNGGTKNPYYYTTYITPYTPTNWSFMWQQAYEISGVDEDAWNRLPTAAGQTFMTNVINSFETQNTADLMWDGWGDDIAWGLLMYTRAYPMTNNAQAPAYNGYPAMGYMALAKKNFDEEYARGWDTFLGGGIWENNNDGSKCTLSNASFIPSAISLYQAYGDASYLQKAEDIYAWNRENLMITDPSNANAGEVGECVHPKTGPDMDTNAYNGGLMLNAAAYLYRITGNPQYYNDALMVAKFQTTKHPIMNTEYAYNGPFGADQFYRGLSNFARWNGLWNNYSTWFQNNATQAWSVRDTKYNITEDNISNQTADWNTTTPSASLCTPAPPAVLCLSMEYSTAVTLQQVSQIEAIVNAPVFSGQYEIQNVNSGLALAASADSTANGSAVVQQTFASGDSSNLWTVTPTSGGYYTITNVNSGLNVDVASASAIPGASIVQQSAHTMLPGDDQWMPVVNADGSYTFFNLNSELVLDLPNQSTASGTQVQQWFSNGNTNQAFKLTQINANTPQTAKATLSSPLNFTASTNTTSAAQTATLTNTGSTPLNGISISLGGANPADFALSATTCGSTLAAGASCTVSATFSTPWPGNYSATLFVADNATGAPQKATLSGTATGAAPSYNATVAPSALTFAAAVNTNSPVQPVTITNTGDMPISGITYKVSGTNATNFWAPTTTCGNTLPTGSSCVIYVMFGIPSTTNTTPVGNYSATLTITDSAVSSPQTIALTSTVAATTPAGVVTLSPSSLYFTANTGVPSNTLIAILQNNNISQSLTGIKISIGGTNAADFKVVANNCGGTQASNGTCFIMVNFQSATAGTFTGTLSVADSATNTPQTVALTGTATTADYAATLTPSLTFSATAGSTAAAQIATLKNIGNQTLAIGNISVGGTNANDFSESASTCESTLAAGDSCSIFVTFESATSGTFTGTLTVADNATGSSQTATLSGTATPAPTYTATLASALSFTGYTGIASAPQAATLTNTGNQTLTGLNISIGGANASAFAVSSTTCGSTLAAGASCAISVTFNSTTAGTITGTLSVSGASPFAAQSVNLSGTATQSTYTATLSPAMSFTGYTGLASAPQTATLTNTGNQTLTGLNISPLTGAFTQSATTCGSTLAVGANCTISITFHSTIVGTSTGTLSVSAASPGATQSIKLSGTATQATYTATLAPALSFTSIAGTTTSAQTATLTNTGNQLLNGVAISLGGTNPSDFAVSSTTCASTLAPGATCAISVTFTSATVGSFAATLSVADSAANSPQTASLSGTATTPTYTIYSGLAGMMLNTGTTSTSKVFITADASGAAQWTYNGSQLMTNGLCLDAKAKGTANGTLVQIYSCNGGTNQVWTLTNGTLVNPESGKCLDDPNLSTTNGTQLELWTCNGGKNQQWTLTQ